MADTSNLTRFLTDVAKAIKDKKGSTDLIPAANFDTEIMNLPSGGLDTSDATATAEDIAQGKTAYVKDQKVEGTVWDARGTIDETFLAGPSEYEVNYENADNGNGGWVNVYSKFDNPVIMNEHSKVHTGVLGSFVANAVGLTPDKIATGNTILGVVGTASAGDGQMTQEEYDNAVITTEYILGWRQPEVIPEYYDQTITLTGDSSIHQVTVLHGLQPKTDTLGLVWETNVGAGVAIELNTLPDLTEFDIYTDTTEVGMDDAEVIGSTSYGAEIKRKQNEAGVYVFGVYNGGMYFHISNNSEVFSAYGIADIENIISNLTVTLETPDTGVTVNFTDSILESVTFGPELQTAEDVLMGNSYENRAIVISLFNATDWGTVTLMYRLEDVSVDYDNVETLGYIIGDETDGMVLKRANTSYGTTYFWDDGGIHTMLFGSDNPELDLAPEDVAILVYNTTFKIATPAQDISAFAQTLADLPKEEYDAYHMPYVHITTPVLSSDTTVLSTLVERMTNDIPALENDESIIVSFYDGDYRMSFSSASWSRGFNIVNPNDRFLLEFYSISPVPDTAPTGKWLKYESNPDTGESTFTDVTSTADTISFGTAYDKFASMQMTIPDRLRTQEYIYKILSLLETAFNCTIKYKPEE